MKKEIHSFSFSAIRKAIIESKLFLKEEYWEQDPMNCKTAIEYDLGITGDDGWELFEKFEKSFSVDMTPAKENFYQYFDDEGQFANPFIPIYIILIILLASLLIPVYFFNRKLAKDSFFDLLNTTKGKQRENELLVGDLATSILIGKFTQRSAVFVKLKYH